MRAILTLASLVALAACGRPAADQPAAQLADPAAPTTAGAPPPTRVPAAVAFPAVPSLEDVAMAAAAAGLPPTPEDRLYLVCDNGEKMVLRLFPEQGVASLARASGATELQRGSGPPALRYAGGDVVLTGTGEAYRLDLGGGRATLCRAEQPLP